jgi:hypothetical protein
MGHCEGGGQCFEIDETSHNRFAMASRELRKTSNTFGPAHNGLSRDCAMCQIRAISTPSGVTR